MAHPFLELCFALQDDHRVDAGWAKQCSADTGMVMCMCVATPSTICGPTSDKVMSFRDNRVVCVW